MKANTTTHAYDTTDDMIDTRPRPVRLRELTYRYHLKRGADGQPIRLGRHVTSPIEAWLAVRGFLQDEAVEVFGMLCLTTTYRVTCWHELSRGCLDSSLVHPREVFKVAILSNAAGLLLLHNHPSGDPNPSADDVALTRRLVDAGDLLGIPVLDHIIVGDGRFVSLKQLGYVGCSSRE